MKRPGNLLFCIVVIAVNYDTFWKEILYYGIIPVVLKCCSVDDCSLVENYYRYLVWWYGDTILVLFIYWYANCYCDGRNCSMQIIVPRVNCSVDFIIDTFHSMMETFDMLFCIVIVLTLLRWLWYWYYCYVVVDVLMLIFDDCSVPVWYCYWWWWWRNERNICSLYSGVIQYWWWYRCEVLLSEVFTFLLITVEVPDDDIEMPHWLCRYCYCGSDLLMMFGDIIPWPDEDDDAVSDGSVVYWKRNRFWKWWGCSMIPGITVQLLLLICYDALLLLLLILLFCIRYCCWWYWWSNYPCDDDVVRYFSDYWVF